MTSIQDVLEKVKAMLEAYAPLAGTFADVTLAEFPFCQAFPACHVNFGGETDDPGLPGGGFALRRVRVNIYVTLQKNQLTDVQGALSPIVERVRDCIKADRTLGGLLNVAITRLNVSEVPSPVGTHYVGTRRIEFEAAITESLL